MGCGFDKLAEFVNVDKFAECEPDQVWDLEVFPWPWADNSVDEVVFNHSLEHLGETPKIFMKLMQELYRVCKNDTKITIVVPHPRNDNFINDPTHVRAITPDLLELFNKAQNKYWKENKVANSTLGFYLNVDFRVISATYAVEEYYLKLLKTKKMTEVRLKDYVRERNNILSEISIILKVVKE